MRDHIQPSEDTVVRSILFLLLALPLCASAQLWSDLDRTDFPLITTSVRVNLIGRDWAGDAPPDSSLIHEPDGAVCVSWIALYFDSLFTWSDSVKVGNAGINAGRPANIFGCSKADRGSDSTQTPVAFIYVPVEHLSSMPIYLYHKWAGGKTGSATVILRYTYIGLSNTVKKTTGL